MSTLGQLKFGFINFGKYFILKLFTFKASPTAVEVPFMLTKPTTTF